MAWNIFLSRGMGFLPALSSYEKSRLRFFKAALFFSAVFLSSESWGAVAGQVSLSVGEEYNDNIFFAKDKQHDFISYIFPTFSLLYAPPGQSTPALTADFTPIGQIFARHNRESNFGDNLLFRTNYTYQYSPLLAFYAQDTLRRLGETRTGIGDGYVQGVLPGSPNTGPGFDPGFPYSPSIPGLEDFISRGDLLTNQLYLGSRYTYSPTVSFTGNYNFAYTDFIDEGGRDIWHGAGVRGYYKWKEYLSLYAGYGINVSKSRNGDDGIVHNLDLGADTSAYKIELTPTLTVSASGGIALNSLSGGPRVAGRGNVTVTKVWEGAVLSGGARKELTPSFGVAGISDTTSLFASFNIKVTEALTAFSGVTYSFYDTDDVNFNTFQAAVGSQYRINRWLAANLRYAHRWIDGGAGANSTDLLTRGKVSANSVFLFLTSRFDVWPNVGLAQVYASR